MILGVGWLLLTTFAIMWRHAIDYIHEGVHWRVGNMHGRKARVYEKNPPPQPTTHPPTTPTEGCTAPSLDSIDDSEWTALRRLGLEALRRGERVPVVYVHVFKAGGTSVCNVAKAVGQRTNLQTSAHGPEITTNCNMPPGFFFQNASQQAGFLRKHALEFVGNEFDGLPMDEGQLLSPACAVWAISMRDPVERFLSHFSSLQRRFKQVIVRNQNNTRGPGQDLHIWRHKRGRYGISSSRQGDREPVFTNSDLETMSKIFVPGRKKIHVPDHQNFFRIDEISAVEFAHFLRTQPEAALTSPALRSWVAGDFYVRHLAGAFSEESDLVSSEALFAKARQRLSRLFSVIIVTDDLGARQDDPWRVLRSPLGWEKTKILESTPVRANAAPMRIIQASEEEQAKLRDNLRVINSLDVKLFEFARELSGTVNQ